MRMTHEIGSLAAGDGGEDWRHIAIVGGPWDQESMLARGFFDVADAAVEAWKAGGRNDAMVIPIIYNYRHGIELALKAEIRSAAACIRADGAAKPEDEADTLNLWLANNHSIGSLVSRLTSLLRRLQLGSNQQLPVETLKILQQLHLLDRSGQAFRYSTKKTGPAGEQVLEAVRPEQEHFDIIAVAQALHDAGNMVMGGVGGVLDAYSDYQNEMRYYYGA